MVITVTATYVKNGNQRSRPFVAGDESDALVLAAAEWDIEEGNPDFTWQTRRVEDADGSYERALVDAEKRHLENEYYRMPSQPSRGRLGRKRR